MKQEDTSRAVSCHVAMSGQRQALPCNSHPLFMHKHAYVLATDRTGCRTYILSSVCYPPSQKAQAPPLPPGLARGVELPPGFKEDLHVSLTIQCFGVTYALPRPTYTKSCCDGPRKTSTYGLSFLPSRLSRSSACSAMLNNGYTML